MQGCASSFLCQTSNPPPFPGPGIFSFWDILCHFHRPGHFEIALVFLNVSAPDSVIRNREHFWVWASFENIFTVPSEWNHHLEKKSGWWTTIFPVSGSPGPESVSGREFWIFLPSPTGDIWRVQFSLLLPVFTSYKLHQKSGEPSSAENWASTRLWRTDAIRPRAPF